MSVLRFDAGTIQKVTKTPQGGIRVTAALSGPHVLEYRTPTGIRREYRPAEVMFHADSLASIDGAPVTDDHPKEQIVTADNFDRLAKGHASNPRQDGDRLVADLTIQSNGLISKLDTKREVSLGYWVEVDETPGVTPSGERYDAVHTAYVVNHVAVVSKARSKGAQLYLDSYGNQTSEECAKVTSMDIESVKAERDAAIKRAGELESERDSLQARFDDAEAKLSELPATARRIAGLIVTAEKHKVEVKADASESDIRDAILTKVCPGLDLGDKSEDYKQARLDAALDAAPSVDSEKTRDALRVDAQRTDEDPGPPPWVVKARENDDRMINSGASIVLENK